LLNKGVIAGNTVLKSPTNTDLKLRVELGPVSLDQKE
jgi:hypothetical protein